MRDTRMILDHLPSLSCGATITSEMILPGGGWREAFTI